MTKDWLNLTEYPFKGNFLNFPEGKMHFVDEGEGSPIVFVHGTPVWSFVWRNYIKELSKTHRCIAPDHLGFGLSDKPADGKYTPADHARRLEALIETLGLEDITLVVHDMGGAVGLSYALQYPNNVRRIVLFNTWMWSLEDDKQVQKASGIFNSAFGRFFYLRMNGSPRYMLKMAFHDKSKLTKNLHKQYRKVFEKPADRHAMFAVVKALLDSGNWWNELWSKRERIADKPALILWGEKDPLLTIEKLDRWETVFKNLTVVHYPDCGHFIQEENPNDSLQQITEFINSK